MVVRFVEIFSKQMMSEGSSIQGLLVSAALVLGFPR